MENNKDLVFNRCNTIKELNKVEGFNPLDYVTRLNEHGEEQLNLDTKYRQLWFRLRYPNGKITKKILRLDDHVAAVEAKVYFDKNDPEENYVSSGVAQRFYDANKDFGMYYLESAETIAEGRALGKAGFGIQFCDFDGQRDDVMAEAGVKIQPNSNMPKHQSDSHQGVSSEIKADTNKSDTALSKKQGNGTKSVPQGNQQEPNEGNKQENKADVAEQTVPNKANANTDLSDEPNYDQQDIYTEAENVSNEPEYAGGVKYDANTPVEEILKVMTIEEAENITVNVGFNKGKTLRQVWLKNYKHLKWFFEGYNGDDNMLIAGAKLLYDASEQQQKAS